MWQQIFNQLCWILRATYTYVFYRSISGILISAAFLISQAEASEVSVVLTGDSLTATYKNYGPITDPDTFFAGTGYDVNFQTFAYPGICSKQYAGYSSYNSTTHDYAQDVANADPNYIVFLMGANDIFYTDGWSSFQTYIPDIFDHWKDNTKVIVLSMLPQTRSAASNNNDIDSLYNPFLKETAALYGFTYLDVNTLMQEQSNWEDLYINEVHLNSNGYSWLAHTVCVSLAAQLPATSTPEPSSLALITAAALCLVGYSWRRKYMIL